MVYATNILRLVVSGSLYSVEEFSWSLSFMPNFASDPVPPAEVPAGIITAVETFHTSGIIAPPARLQTIKLNMIGPNGRYVDDGDTVLHDFSGTGVPGTGSTQPPPQIALAITTRTANQRGRAHAGRFYIPVPPFGAGSDGRITTSQAETAATAATALLDGLNASVGPDWILGVTSSVGTGVNRQITHVSVGRVLDTIRSRRSSLAEEPVVGPPLA